MGFVHKLSVVQIVYYLLLFVTSVVLTISLVSIFVSMNCNCLFFASGKWTSNDTLHVEWGPPSACLFPIIVAAIVLVSSLFYTGWLSLKIYWMKQLSWRHGFVNFITTLISLIMSMVSSTITLAGSQTWCHLISPKFSCIVSESIPIEGHPELDTSDIVMSLHLSQFFSWACCLLTMLLVISAMIRMVRYQRHESFFRSLAREQQMLVQSITPADQSDAGCLSTATV